MNYILHEKTESPRTDVGSIRAKVHEVPQDQPGSLTRAMVCRLDFISPAIAKIVSPFLTLFHASSRRSGVRATGFPGRFPRALPQPNPPCVPSMKGISCSAFIIASACNHRDVLPEFSASIDGEKPEPFATKGTNTLQPACNHQAEHMFSANKDVLETTVRLTTGPTCLSGLVFSDFPSVFCV